VGQEFTGNLSGGGLRIGIVAGRFNSFVTERLLSGCMDGLVRHGVDAGNVDVAWVPGAFEIPLVAQRMARSGRYDAVICLGAVIRGETPHFEYVSGQAASGAARAGLDADLPVIFGVLTTETVAQAIERNNATLIDARPADYFNGQTRHAAARSAGTLKGAVNLEHASWFAPGSSSFVSVEEARRVAAALKLDPQRDTLSFCNTGHWAATNWFALSEVLGQPQVKLYAGSMVDWTAAPQALPMDNAPGRVGQLMVDFKMWAARTLN